MYTATLRKLTLRCDRMGSGEPLVLIHGLGERKEAWVCQYALANSYDLIIPDLPGHGQSTPAEEVSIEAFARDTLELLDVLGVESAHICGLSMGGVVAQEMYRMAPDRCRSLILVNTFFLRSAADAGSALPVVDVARELPSTRVADVTGGGYMPGRLEERDPRALSTCHGAQCKHLSSDAGSLSAS